jgi:hypothetical protein
VGVTAGPAGAEIRREIRDEQRLTRSQQADADRYSAQVGVTDTSSGPGVASYPSDYGPGYTGGYVYEPGAATTPEQVGGRTPEERAKIDRLNEQAVAAAIKAIEKQYNLSEQELLAGQSEVSRQYKLLKIQALRARDADIEQIAESAAGRGVYRSGIRIEQQADVQTGYAEYVADIESRQQVERDTVQRQIELGKIQKAADVAQARADRQGRVLTVEELDALTRAGLA